MTKELKNVNLAKAWISVPWVPNAWGVIHTIDVIKHCYLPLFHMWSYFIGNKPKFILIPFNKIFFVQSRLGLLMENIIIG